MANGLKRVSNFVRGQVLDMDAGDVASFRSKVKDAARHASPVRKSDLRDKIAEFADIDTHVFHETPAGDYLSDLASQVQEAIDARDDGFDAEKLLSSARAENMRKERGMDLRGCGEYPQLLWNRACRVAQRVDDGLINVNKGLELIQRKDLHEDAICDVLGQFLAAYEAACDAYGKMAKADRKADRRAREHKVVGRINFHDNQRRARIAGRDPTAAMDNEIASLKQMVSDLSRLVSVLGGDKPKRPVDVNVVEMEVE